MNDISLEDLRLVFRVVDEMWNHTPIASPAFHALREVRSEVATWIVWKEQGRK